MKYEEAEKLMKEKDLQLNNHNEFLPKKIPFKIKYLLIAPS